MRPFWAVLPPVTAFSLGMVLAIMVFPIMISISKEVFRTVPFEIREASFALGVTKLQTVKHVVKLVIVSRALRLQERSFLRIRGPFRELLRTAQGSQTRFQGYKSLLYLDHLRLDL